MRRFLGRFILLILFFPLSVLAASYHVATTGSDSNAGGGTDPFATIQKGIDSLSPGDTVIVHGGTYSDFTTTTYSSTSVTVMGYLSNLTASSASLPYIIQAAAGETVILDAGPSGVELGFLIRNSNYVTIEGFEFQNFALVQTNLFSTAVLHIDGGQSVVISSNTISDSATTPQESYDIAMNNTVDGQIVNNTITTGKYYSLFMGFSSASDSPNAEISGNRIEFTGSAGTRSLAMRPARIDHLRILDNYVLHSATTAHDESYAMQLRDMTGYTVSGNVIEGWPNGIDNFDYSGRDEQGLIVNNTFVDITGGNAILAQSCSGCRTANNIFYSVAGFGINCSRDNADNGTDHEISNNLYFNVVRDALFINPYTGGAGCTDLGGHVTSDPLFTADGDKADPYYMLQSESPARDVGNFHLCHVTPSDGACDIGAFEFGQSTSTPPPPASSSGGGCRSTDTTAGFAAFIALFWTLSRARRKLSRV